MSYWKIAPALLAGLLFAAAACAFGGESAAYDPMGSASDPAVEDAGDAFKRSVARYEQAGSLRIEMTYTAEVPGEPLTATAVMSMQKPGQLYMTVERSDQRFVWGNNDSFEMLMDGATLYMTDIAFQTGEMFVLEIEEGSTGSTLADSMLLGYADLVAAFDGEIEDLGEEQEDGLTLRRFRATVELRDLIAALSDTLTEPEVLGRELPYELPDPELEHPPMTPVQLDIWTYPYSFVPHRIELATPVSDPGWLKSIAMTFTFSGYNEPVEIPAPPAHAITFEDAMEEWLGDVEDYEDDLDTNDRYGFQLEGPVLVTDVNGDGAMTGAGGDTISFDLSLKAGSPGIAHDVLIGEGWIRLADSEQELGVSHAEASEVYGNGDTIIDEGELHTLRITLPEGLELGPSEVFTIDIPNPPDTLLLISRTMPPEIGGEMVLF